MTYRIHILPAARKELAGLAAGARERVDRCIRALADNPRPHGVLPMKGQFKGLYRARVGDYRIVYQVRDEVLLIIVVRVGHRKDVYRRK